MAVTEYTGNTQTATINTEHSLALISAAGVYQLVVNLSNMANGDVLELRAYLAVRSTNSRLLAKIATYANKQGDGTADSGGDGEVIAFSIPFSSPFDIRFTLKQTAGTGKDYIWSVYQL